MRLFVLGATGRTGRGILDLAPARGHRLTLFTRSPQKLAALADDSRVTITTGDARDVDALARAMKDHDAVLSALGPTPLEALRATTLLTETAAATVGAMTRAGVNRLAIVSVAFLFPLRGLGVRIGRALLRHHVRDSATMEAIVAASHLAWTIARPPRLVDRDEVHYHAARDALPDDSRVASYKAVAAFLLDAVERNEWVHQIVGVAR